MLPSTLDITREECCGILRRLELESYSNVVSTFRAQGGLNDIKKKILEDLRGVFHISQDRHRAEVRRVANDERLCTIADVISGPNTTQEWCLEGRRSFPLLARNFTYTAFTSVANVVAEKIIYENSKLPSLSEIQQKIEETQIQSLKTEEVEENYIKPPIIKEDPSIPVLDEKKKTKRPVSYTEQPTSNVVPAQRKRTTSDNNESNKLDDQSQIHTNVRIQQLYHNHCKTVSRHKKSSTKRKTSLAQNKETLSPTENTKAISPSQNTKSPVYNILEFSTTESKLSVGVPNPHILHTYASLSHNKNTVQQNSRYVETKSSQQQQYQNNDGIDTQKSIKSPHVSATSKKDIANNLMKLNLSSSQAKQIPATFIEEKRNDKPVNSINSLNTCQLSPEKTVSSISNDTISSQPLFSLPLSLPPPPPISSSPVLVSDTIPSIQAEKNLKTVQLLPPSTSTSTISSDTSTIIESSSSLLDNNKKAVDVSVHQELQNPIIKATTAKSSPTIVQIKSQQIPVETRIIQELGCQKVQEKISSPVNTLPIIKRKIQITNPQIIHPIKIAPGGLQGIQNRKGIKIISSANGQVFIQSTADGIKTANLSSSPKLTQMITSAQKNIIPTTGNIGGNPTVLTPTTKTIIPNRLSLQKVHILPKLNKQQILLPKSNQIYVQTNVTNSVTIASGGPTATTITTATANIATNPENGTIRNQSFGNIIIDKTKRHHESVVVSSPSKLLQSNNSLLSSQTQTPHNNVIVIGSVPSSTKKDIGNNNQNLDIGHQLNKGSMITEDTPVYILTTPVSNLDKSTPIDLNCITAATDTTTVITGDQHFDDKIIESVQVVNSEMEEQILEDDQIISEEVQLEYSNFDDIEINDNGANSNGKGRKLIIDDKNSKKEIVYEVTDWEVELDQEAIRAKERNTKRAKLCHTTLQPLNNKIITTTNGVLNDTENFIYMGDNFNDVIEVEGIESDSIVSIENRTEDDIEGEIELDYETSYGSQII